MSPLSIEGFSTSCCPHEGNRRSDRRHSLDEDVVALGLDLEDLARLDAADFLVVEGQVEDAGRFDQAVVSDDRNALCGGLGDGRHDGAVVLGQHDQGGGPSEIRPSTSASCLEGELWASALI